MALSLPWICCHMPPLPRFPYFFLSFFFRGDIFQLGPKEPPINQTILTRMTRPIIDKLFLHRMTVRQEKEWGRGDYWLDEWNTTQRPPNMPEETGVYLSDSIKSAALWRTKLPAPRHALAAIICSWTLSQSQWFPHSPFCTFLVSLCALRNRESHHSPACVCVSVCVCV